ncbi:GNAT family N-acetyltransferase [Marinifilum caeruleilacunae]|uniref:N-acetyltransferase n=1 Tax=Marinifilum caeruleilacunae TaxID=2499076 RepID=A0ABX1WY31_9BACT|nr:GNAT family N-acetyltransferase [Marinifilum caeruleilacunae]NOU60947.1 N-acetyltransferase [Marinifilum caeruleilacunae]
MKIIIETERLQLREFVPDDAQSMFDLNADPEVIRYTGDPPFESVNQARTFLENYADYEKNGYGRWAMIAKENQEFIGWCGLKLIEEGLIDLGFRVFRTHWNKGYASEAAKACIDYGFNKLGFDEIIGRVVAENTASVKVLEKMGMQYWKNDICHGFENARYYRISKESNQNLA